MEGFTDLETSLYYDMSLATCVKGLGDKLRSVWGEVEGEVGDGEISLAMVFLIYVHRLRQNIQKHNMKIYKQLHTPQANAMW